MIRSITGGEKNMDERLKKQMDFLLEIDKMKEITRQTYLADGSRKENDAEHSFHLAIMAYLLSEYANEPVNREKTMIMCLVHDLVEIYAGDTYAYDKKGYESKAAREQAAAEKLYSLLPKDQGEELKALWEEFEAVETPEARFANVLDRIQPVMLTDAANGKSWKEHGVQKSWITGRNKNLAKGSETLASYCMELIEKNVENGNIGNDRTE